MQADNLGTGLPQIVMAMITSNVARLGHPSRVFIPLNPLAAKGAGLATAPDKAIVSKLGQLHDMKPVEAALRATLGL